MALKSSTNQYGTIAIVIHWISAMLLLVLLGTGYSTALADDPSDKADFLIVHAPLGLSMLALTIIRVLWWLVVDKKPQPIGGMDREQEIASHLVHLSFYGFILVMAASGIGMMIVSGAREILFEGAPGPLPDFWSFIPRWPHAIGARILVVLVIAHIGAALYHHFSKGDGLLRRMWW